MCFMHPKVKAAVALRSYLAVVPHKGESPFESKNATQGSNINSPVVLKSAGVKSMNGART